MNNKLSVCKVCGQEIAKSAKNCPHCGAKNKKPSLILWVIVIICIAVIAGICGSAGGGGTAPSGTEKESPNPTVNTVVSVFDGDCGINATAEIGNNIINYPELSITITNTSSKEIAAIKFYAVPYDVYGNEIKGWTTQSNLYTDTAIPAGKTTTVSYQLIEQSVKTVKLYVYSVYFADGTEWGDKDATTSKILSGAPTIEVTVKS